MSEGTITYDGPLIEPIPRNIEDEKFFREMDAITERLRVNLFASLGVPQDIMTVKRGDR